MLNAKHRLAIYMLIQGYSNAEISAELGVHPSTVRWWMNKNPEFKQTLQQETQYANERCRAQIQATVRRTADNACAGLRAMQTILLNERTDGKTIAQCTKTMLQCLTKLSDFLKGPAIVPLLESDDPKELPALAETPQLSEPAEVELNDSDDSTEESEDPPAPVAVSASASGAETDAEPADPGPIPCDTLRDDEMVRLGVLYRKFAEDEHGESVECEEDGEEENVENTPTEELRASTEE